jgi:galactokinase
VRAPARSAGEFEGLFGHPPVGTWAAPGRVNLIGEFTDYNDGFVLPLALPYSARASAAARDDDIVRVASAQRSEAGRMVIVEAELEGLEPGMSGWSSYVLGVVWALRESGADLSGVDLLLDSDVPSGAGLSSSAALECSVALALRDLYDLPFSLQELALIAQRAENEFVGVPTGIMDQTASMRCQAGHALFLDTRSLQARQVPFDLAPAGLKLLVVNTGVKHALGSSAYADRRHDCLLAAAELGVAALRDVPPDEMDSALARLSDAVIRRRARHIISEQGRVLEVVRLLEAGRPDKVGPVLTAGHRSLRDDFEVSCVELDTVVDVSLADGALGARMTGGGFGGSAVVLLELAAVASVTLAVVDAFVAEGFAKPEVFEVVASDGAARVA